jgi:hypothetical protein
MKWGRVILIICCAVLITALGIDASDTINGSKGTMLSQLVGSKDTCPSGMYEVEGVPNITCVDMYEASTGKDCPVKNPEQVLATQQNIDTQKCVPESKPDVLPWRFVTRDQAMQLCARSGKRLPTSVEWYTTLLGSANVEKECNVLSKKVSKTGEFTGCVSPGGAYDLVGNVWEWVSDDVINGVYNGNSLPPAGYVAQVDSSGVATLISQEPQDVFGKDYFWSRNEGAFGIIRGGYYDSGTDGGIFTVHADTPPTTAGTGIGFRCLK